MVAKTLWLTHVASLLILSSCGTLLSPPNGVGGEGAEIDGSTQVIAESIAEETSSRPLRDAPEPKVALTANEARVASMPGLDASAEQAIKQLRSQALTLQSEGNWQQAGLILERALRIDAQKADLYQQLATVRLGEQRFSEAEQIALKGLTNSADSPQLSANLWQIVAQCRSAVGDISGAEEARAERDLWLNRR